MSELEHSWVASGILLAAIGAVLALPFYCVYKGSQQQEQAILRWRERCAKEAQDESDFKKELESRIRSILDGPPVRDNLPHV